MGHDISTHRSQLGFLAVVDRDAHVHPHCAQSRPQGRRHAIGITVSNHVLFTNPCDLCGRPTEQAERHHVDNVQKNLEHHIHVGRRCWSGDARLHGRQNADHRSVRIHRVHRVHVECWIQH